MENLTPPTTIMRLKISGVMEEDRASELRELDGYFNVLEEDRRRLQNQLQEQKEVHVLALKALERERTQEREEWEKVMQEREEALCSAFLSLAISRERLMKDLMGRQSATNLRQTAGNPPTVTLDKQSRKWWCFRRRQATPDLMDANRMSADEKAADLQRIAKLEERVRKSELKKQQKALQKAEQQAKRAAKRALKAERRAQKERKKAENRDDEAKGINPRGPTDQNVMYIYKDGQEIMVHFPVRCKCLFCVIGRKRMARRNRSQ